VKKDQRPETRDRNCAHRSGGFVVLSLFALLLLHASVVFAASPYDLFPLLVDTLCRADYAAGDSIAAQIERDYPGHPAAMLARAGVKAFYAVDVTGGSEDIDVLAMLDSVARKAEEWKSHSDENQASLSFIRGCALFGRGLILSRQGKVFQGIPQVITARSEFGHAIESEPDFFDAYLGRGAFRYVKVVFLSKFDPFHLVSNEGQARQDVDLAIARAQYTHWLAVDLLAWLAPSRHEYGLADSLCASGLRRFPGSRTFLWPLAWSQLDAHNYESAEKTCLDLLHQYQQIPEDHGFELIWLYDKLMTCADNLGRPEDALSYARAGLAVPYTKFVFGQRKDQLKHLSERVKK